MSGEEKMNSDEATDRPATEISISDRSLLRRYGRGDDDAATAIYLRYAERLRALAEAQASNDLKRRVDAEEMVQSVFRTFFRRAADGQYEIPEGDELWKLLLVIGLNKIRSLGIFHRAKKRDLSKTDMGIEGVASLEHASDEDESAIRILHLTIDEILTALPSSYREVVDLRVAGYEVAEIAERCGRSKRSIERILQEFRKKLGSYLHDDS